MRIQYMILLFFSAFAYSDLQADQTPPPVREKLYHESLRPQFHFTARYWDDYQLNPPNHEEGWLNDLNGLVYNDGQYHLFAQRWWSAWLHATSTDLIHWKEYRPAFGKGGKFGGTQSGGGVVDLNNSSGLGDGTEPPMIAFWSSTDNESQCISYSLDKGQTWTKYDQNPVLVHKFRDPKVFWYEPDQKWIMVLYGPADQVRRQYRYGFNGEENDAHNLRDFNPDQWTCSSIRMHDNGNVIASDQHGTSDAQIDIDRQNTGAEVFCVGAKANRSEFFQGDIAEILVYNRTLTEEETANTLATLQSKRGLLKTNKTTEIPRDGLVLHLDAAKLSNDSRGQVSSWKDLSGNANDMAQSDTDQMPTRINNAIGHHPAVRFRNAQFLRGPAVLTEGNDAFTIVALWRRQNNSGSQVICEQNTQSPQPGRRASLLTVCNEQSENVYLLFSSTNLLDWKKLDGHIEDSFECPDMFELPIEGQSNQSKWVVIDGNGDYVTGRFDGQQFTPEAKKRKGDFGRNFYATMTFQNMPEPDPRRVQLAWMRGWDDYPKNMPFNQQITFPCELTLRNLPQGLIMCRYPIDEISLIHDEPFILENHTLTPGQNPLADLKGDLYDINLVVDVSQSTCSELILNMRGNTVSYDLDRKVLTSVDSQVPLVPRNGLVEIRILMDRLSIETFGNQGEVSITNIAYQKDDTPHLQLQAVGNPAKIVSLTAHKLTSIWR